ncbi:MAG: hypothetical protein JO033_09240 [Acidobacteriaceae bacterium]|nr:hypothetical protein [Acidobacteriaceae bacterium]
MALEFLPVSEDHLPSVRAFNQRMRDGNAPTGFFLPENPSRAPDPNSAVHWTQFVAVEDGAVRGGVIQMDQPGWLENRMIRALNYQSPLSEGILEGRHGMVGLQLVKFMQRSGEAVFIVGMGSAENPLPRLLKAAGWSIRPVPFLFRVRRAGAFFRQLPTLHSSRIKSIGAHTAAYTGVGSLALHFMQRRRCSLNASVRQVREWGAWVDEIWERFEPRCSFAVKRDLRTVQELYPSKDPRVAIFLIQQDTHPVAWSVGFQAKTRDHLHFGNLQFATVVDCAAAATDAMPAAAALTYCELASRGADLVLTNVSHRLWVDAFRAAGFLVGPSNYHLGMSKALTGAIQRQADGDNRIHVTRGDGDGRVGLS